MGLTYATVRIRGPMGERTLKLLVDTGSLLSWLSRRTLEEIGVQPQAKRAFRTIDRTGIVRDTGEAVFEVMGERATRLAAFAEEGDAEVLGADTLEELGLEVDSGSKEPKKIQVFAAYFSN